MKSDEYEDVTKRITRILTDLNNLSNRVEVIHSVVRSNRARINQIKVDKIVNESEKDINDDGVVFLGEGRLKP